jgi:hypothetical protein
LLKSDKQNTITSDLQEKILRHICKTRNADYKSISKATGRDRITILQSLQPLMKHHYIYKQKIDPNRIKGKLIFKPTQKGIAYAIAFLGTDFNQILKAQQDASKITKYNQFIEQINDPELRKRLSEYTIRKFIEYDLFDDEGRIMVSSRQDMLKQGFRMGILEQAKDKDFNPYNLFNPQSVELFIKIFSHGELKELKEFLIKIKNNLDLTIKQLPD